MVDLKVNLCGKTLDNPIIPASGSFGYGYEFAELYDINCLGTFSFKGTTKEPRFGNPTPRTAECPSCVLNAVGLQNPGVDKVISEELPKLKKVFHKGVMANISGFSLEEYVYVASRLDKCDQVDFLEINMKLSPNVTDIAEIAKACEAGGADGVSLINTPMGMRIDLKTRKPIIKNVTGGMSGPAVFPLALRMVWQTAKAVKIPVIGIGGVSSAEDVIEMMLAGATAVGIGAQNLVNPYACRDIINDLPGVMEKYNITKLSDITGGVNIG